MEKYAKKVNPYEKKKKRNLKITREQRIAIIIVACVVVLLVGIAVGKKVFNVDEHAGHDHSAEGEEHYEGDGHDHGSANSNTGPVTYRYYTNEDKTYRVQVLDKNSNVLFEKDKLANIPVKTDLNETIVELSWATGSGTNEFDSIYWNKKTGQVSQMFHAPRGTDGVRIAYPSEDQTKVIVQDVFNKATYYKEYSLPNPYTGFSDVIVGGSLGEDNTVGITYYIDNQKNTLRTYYKLYE